MNKIKEFGDYQTPIELTHEIMEYLEKTIDIPNTILEPTCGLGSFMKSARISFPNATLFGFDINENYLNDLKEEFTKEDNNYKIHLEVRNFFDVNWVEYLNTLDPPILVVGNPPWITSSEMSVIKGNNIPEKTNIKNIPGIEAMTGKSNFDISEWMIMRLSSALNLVNGTLAMLCKVSVARKLFTSYKQEKFNMKECNIFLINTKKLFGAIVDACLFFVSFNDTNDMVEPTTCKVFDSITNNNMVQEIGFEKSILIANINYFKKWKHLSGKSNYIWRSGIKHDAVKVMELTKVGDIFYNGYGDEVQIESNYLYPMLKSSDLANGDREKSKKWMIVPQKKIGEETSTIKKEAPLTWDYLNKHSEKLDKRKSSIYSQKPRFSIFGVGDYTFKKWKIAISGFYKSLNFYLIPPIQGKPVVFDDTCYFLSTNLQEEANHLSSLLNQDSVKEFYQSFIFWDAKRPITKSILKKLCIEKLIAENNKIEKR